MPARFVHLVPDDDVIEHDTDPDVDCVCGPTVEPVKRDDGSVSWVHHHHALVEQRVSR